MIGSNNGPRLREFKKELLRSTSDNINKLSKHPGSPGLITHNAVTTVRLILNNFSKWPKEQMTAFLQAVFSNNCKGLPNDQKQNFDKLLSTGLNLDIALLMINYIIEMGNIDKFYDPKVGFHNERFELWVNSKSEKLLYNLDSSHLSEKLVEYSVEVNFVFGNIEIKKNSIEIFSLDFSELSTLFFQYSVDNQEICRDFSSIVQPAHILKRYVFNLDTRDGLLAMSVLNVFNKELNYTEKKNLVLAFLFTNHVFPYTQRKERAFFETLKKAIDKAIKDQIAYPGGGVELEQQIRIILLTTTYICDVGVEDAFEENGDINFSCFINWVDNGIDTKQFIPLVELEFNRLSTIYDGKYITFCLGNSILIPLLKNDLRFRNTEANLPTEVIVESEMEIESFTIKEEANNVKPQLTKAGFSSNVKIDNNQTETNDKGTESYSGSGGCLNAVVNINRDFGGITINGRWEGNNLVLNSPFTIWYGGSNKNPVKVRNCKGTINKNWKLSGEVTDYTYERTIYNGTLKNGLKHGSGSYTNFSQINFKGKWKDDELDTSQPFKVVGQEFETLDVSQYNGSKIEADQNWYLNGEVTMKYRTGIYKGNIEHNVKCGGVYVNSKGVEYHGKWKDGNLNTSDVTVIFPEKHTFKLILEAKPVYFNKFEGYITEDTFALKKGILLPVVNPSSSNTDDIKFDIKVFQHRTCSGIYESETRKFDGCFSLVGRSTDSKTWKLRRGTMHYLDVATSNTISYHGSFDDDGLRHGTGKLTLANVVNGHKIVLSGGWKNGQIINGQLKVNFINKEFAAGFEVVLSNFETSYDFSQTADLLIKAVNEGKFHINYTNFENVSTHNNHVESEWFKPPQFSKNVVYLGTINEDFVPHGQGKATTDSSKLVFDGEFMQGTVWTGELSFSSGDKFIYEEGKVVKIKYKDNSTASLCLTSQSNTEVWVYKEDAEDATEVTLVEEKTQGRNKLCEIGSKKILILADGSKVEELYVNSKKQRERIYSDGRRYTGNMDSDGNPSGKGKLTFSDGVIYEGTFENGLLRTGKKIFANKEYDEGVFDENEKMTGSGTRYRAGKTTKTIFTNDEADGKNTIIIYTKDQINYCEKGAFFKGKQIGEWKVAVMRIYDKYQYTYYVSYDESGNSTGAFYYNYGDNAFAYEGDTGGVGGTEPHGMGLIKYPVNGSWYDGEVKHGKKDGIGKLLYPDGIIQAQFKNDQYCGWINLLMTSSISPAIIKFSGKGTENSAVGVNQGRSMVFVGEFMVSPTNNKFKNIIPHGEIAIFTKHGIEIGTMEKGEQNGVWNVILPSDNARISEIRNNKQVNKPEVSWCNALAELLLMKIHQKTLSHCLFENVDIVTSRKEKKEGSTNLEIIYANNDKYVGSVAGVKMQKAGKGTFTFAGGYIVYSGQFNDSGKFHGIGSLTMNNPIMGTFKYTGLFCNGKFISGVYEAKSKERKDEAKSKERHVRIYSRFDGLVPEGEVYFEDLTYNQMARGKINDGEFRDTWYCITEAMSRQTACSMNFTNKTGKAKENSVKTLADFQKEIKNMEQSKKLSSELTRQDQRNYLNKKQFPEKTNSSK